MSKKVKSIKIFTLLLFFLSLMVGMAYISWRWMYTLNLVTSPYTTFWSYSLLVAEFLTLVVFTNFSLILLNLDKLEDVVIDNKLQQDYCKDIFHGEELVTFKNYCPSVDIFICTLSESLDLLSMTISACKNIDYPNKHVYVLDDGRRDELKQLTEMLGCNYITRQTNKGYKAGNINNALSQTNSELIVIFDADHVAASTFLRETVYNFIDENLALVQTPQHFCNLDAFQKNLELPNYLANEQDIFYEVMEPSLNEVDSVFCGGTNIIIRRKHLNSVGNFPESTITEDSLLGLILHSNGYRVFYYNRPIAIGLAASSFNEYIKQRCRWAKGNLQIFLNPKNWKYYAKLNPLQAFFYLSAALYFLTPIARFIFLLAPVLFLFFDISPLLVLFYQVFAFQIVYFALKFLFISARHVRPGNVILADVYDLITAIFTIGSILQVVLVPNFLLKMKFSVTKKESHSLEKNYKYKTTLFFILGLVIAAEIQGIYEILFVDVYSMLAIIANLFWNSLNIIVLCFSIKVVFEKPEKRQYQRVNMNDNIVLSDCKHHKVDATVLDTSRSGMSFETYEELRDTEECELKANKSGFQSLIKLIGVRKVGNKFLYKSAFRKPISLFKLTKRKVKRLDNYVRFAYKKADMWNKGPDKKKK